MFCIAKCERVLIQQNDGADIWNRSWAEYKNGFGDPSGNYWAGNDQISALTANGRKLTFELQSLRNEKLWYNANYTGFRVLTEAYNFKLEVDKKLKRRAGNTTDGFSYLNGYMFSTYDRDHDKGSTNCAGYKGSGWWYRGFEGWCISLGVNRPTRDDFFHRPSFGWYGLTGVRSMRKSMLKTSRMWLECDE